MSEAMRTQSGKGEVRVIRAHYSRRDWRCS